MRPLPRDLRFSIAWALGFLELLESQVRDTEHDFWNQFNEEP